MLWDDFYDERRWAATRTSTATRWSRLGSTLRGFFGGFVNGMTQDEAPAIDVKLDQAVTDHDDVFIVNNWGPEVTEKNGEPFSFDACAARRTP
ncbi:MAG: hypothetical protein ACLUW6_10355 [Coriobacteriaceae bacterium]